MRDLIVVSIAVAAALMAFKRPWIGVMLWTWLSIMNPHRFTYGFAYDAPLAAMAAGTTLFALLITKERESPFKGTPVTIFCLFIGWITLSWLFGMDPEGDYEQWKKVIKIDFMILIALALLHTKKHILALTWVAAGSLAILGAKGGLFTLATGGNYRVWGPPGSFIEDNNEFALALVMTIPLLRFLQLQLTGKWAKRGMTGIMILCAAAALGSHSRGALLAIAAMTAVFWWRGKNKLGVGITLVAIAPLLILFMPDEWSNRMQSISTYGEDRSALGRFSAWWTAWGIAKNHLFGAGFNIIRADLIAIYSPYPDMVHAAHSIYFLAMGNHGFIGLALFLGIWIATWKYADWLRKIPSSIPEAKWCADLGAMCQVSLVGYAVGGTFLSLTYFDLPYNIMVLVVLARQWVIKKGWETEAVYELSVPTAKPQLSPYL
jgi:putative inorganic carbon (hco3(-)) transporter